MLGHFYIVEFPSIKLDGSEFSKDLPVKKKSFLLTKKGTASFSKTSSHYNLQNS
jgi:hypothetical protein